MDNFMLQVQHEIVLAHAKFTGRLVSQSRLGLHPAF